MRGKNKLGKTLLIEPQGIEIAVGVGQPRSDYFLLIEPQGIEMSIF